jgi:hypothetical protein
MIMLDTVIISVKKGFLRPSIIISIILYWSAPAYAILGEDNINSVTGQPIIDPNLYTELGNQARFDDVVSFTMTDISATGVASAPTAFASGVLIAPNVILTSAHVVDGGKGGFVVAKGQNALTSVHGQTALIGGALGPVASTSTQTFSILNWIPDPNWKPSTDTGTDLAVVQVASSYGLHPITTYNRAGVSESINFVPLYSGTNELNQPFPNIGIAVGYGRSGGGLEGDMPGTSGTKRGALVLLDGKSTVDNQLVLTSHFQDRGQLFNEGLPSNFLEGGTAPGDSGGGLFQNIGVGGTLVQTGVISSFLSNISGTDGYGAEDQFTDISSSASWIQSAALSFGAIVPSTLGTVPSDPFMPIENIASAGTITNAYIFSVLGGVPVYIDPSGQFLKYDETFGPLMTAIYLPVGDIAELWIFDSSQGKFVDSGDKIDGGSWFDFGGPGLADFELFGLPPGAFETGLTFGGGGQVGLDLIAGSTVLGTPESSTWVMMLMGFAGLGLAGYRKAKSARTAVLAV